jgi:hypothetical protein
VSLAISSSCNFNMIVSSVGPETAEVRNKIMRSKFAPDNGNSATTPRSCALSLPRDKAILCMLRIAPSISIDVVDAT